MDHRFDNRGAGDEGRLAQKIYEITCKKAKLKIKQSTVKEDCAGVDFFVNRREVDVKARKNKMPLHTCWIELAKAGDKIGSGWAYSPSKWIAQMMLYEENNKLIKAIFGEYQTNDLIQLLEDKVDFNSKVYKGELYKLYTRWFNQLHRGTMTVVSYEDLESLNTFSELEIPKDYWNELIEFYGYDH